MVRKTLRMKSRSTVPYCRGDMSFLRKHCRRGNFSVDSTGFRRVRAAGNSPVYLTPAS